MADKFMQPFSNGTDFRTWKSKNCDECQNTFNHEECASYCIFEESLAIASVGDGFVRRDLVEFYTGYKGSSYMPNCNYREKNFKAVTATGKLTIEMLKEIYGGKINVK